MTRSDSSDAACYNERIAMARFRILIADDHAVVRGFAARQLDSATLSLLGWGLWLRLDVDGATKQSAGTQQRTE